MGLLLVYDKLNKSLPIHLQAGRGLGHAGGGRAGGELGVWWHTAAASTPGMGS